MSTCKYLADPVREQAVHAESSHYNRVPTPNVPIIVLRDWLGLTDETRIGVAPDGPQSVIIGPEVPCSIDRLPISHTVDGPRTQLRQSVVEYLGVGDGETIRYEKVALGTVRVCVV